LRDNPPPFGPSRITPFSLVAITVSSRFALAFSQRPSTRSLSPIAYTFAVSKKLMPASSA